MYPADKKNIQNVLHQLQVTGVIITTRQSNQAPDVI